jgi:hypothetical protein
VLRGFKHNDTFNPVGMMVTHAYSLARGSRTGRGLREIYDIWTKEIEL